MLIQNSKPKIQNPVCANCGIPIRWQPTVVDGKAYCCLGCAEGGPCECDYDHLPMPGDRVSMVVWREQFVHSVSGNESVWIYKSVQVTRSDKDE